MSSIPTKHIEGDVAVSRNVTIGGKGVVRGSVTVGHNLKVEGWLEAPNIKAADKGLFVSEEKLNEAYPQPEDGWWALVGEVLPAQVYIASDGLWAGQVNEDGTPKVAGTPAMDLTEYREEVEGLTSELETLRIEVAESNVAIQGLSSTQISQGSQIVALENAKGQPNGIATLNSEGKVPASQLPEMPEVPEQRVVPFGGVLTGEAPMISVGSATGNGVVMFIAATNCFVFRKGTGMMAVYYANWVGAEQYGTGIFTAGRTPHKGRLYVSEAKELYLWDGNEFASITASLMAALGGMSLRCITAEEDEALTEAGTHDPNTIYFISEE